MKTNQEKGVIVYIYALLDKNDNPLYIGKSSSPKNRCYGHASYFDGSVRMKILDYFYDRESYWIKKFLKEGFTLTNKEVDLYEESWEIGDIIEISKLKKVRILEEKSGTVYESISEASKQTGISYGTIQNMLKYPSRPVNKSYGLKLTKQQN